MHFTYQNPTRILFGSGQIAAIASQIPTDQKVLLIYGGGSIKHNGVYDQVKSALHAHHWIEFSGVEPNPTLETLNGAIELARKEKVDFILAVGGGSVIDGSKFVAAATLYEGDGWDIMEGKHRIAEALPLGSILTLPATGSESNAGGVVSRKATGEKLGFLSPFVQPKFAVLDPETMVTLPERQLANGLVDAFVHVCEQYLTFPQQAMVQDGYAEALLRNLAQLANEYDQRDRPEWRANLMWTANQALNGLIGAGVVHDWATHMIGHELTAAYGIDHARTLAIVQPALLRERLSVKRAKLEQMGRRVFELSEGDDLAERTIAAIEALYHQVGIDTRLGQYGVELDGQVQRLVNALESHGMTALGEQGEIDLNTSRRILEQAF